MKLYASHSVFPVPDIEKTADFYEKKMGFRRVDYLSATEPHVCLYRDATEIILTQSKNGQHVLSNHELYGYGEDAYFITDDQQDLQEELEAAGVEIVDRLHMTDYHNLEFKVRDLDGRQIIFGKKQWQVADDKIWEELYSRAKSLINDRSLSQFLRVGGAAAALITDKGNIYTGICIETSSSLGMCAERNAMANMITNGESRIRKIVAVMWDGNVSTPCGACQRFMMQLDKDSRDIEVLTDYTPRRTIPLGELIPNRWEYEL